MINKKLPNYLTIFRIILVPIFIWLIFFIRTSTGSLFALIVFIVASITDYLDGMLARKYNVISDFGKIMDPLADKILVAVALFALALPPIDYISIVAVVLILLREIAVTFLRSYYKKKKIIIAANIWGKLKTVTQMVGIITALIYYTMIQYYPQFEQKYMIKAFQYYFWLVVGITLLSGFNYFLGKSKN